MQEKYLERLEELAFMLDHHDDFFPDTTFDIGCWTSDNSTTNVCGTAACALGSAAYYPEFQAEGLSPIDVSVVGGKSIIQPYFEGRYGFTAGALFFGIKYLESEWLFDPYEYGDKTVTPKEVSARVRQLIKYYRQLENIAA